MGVALNATTIDSTFINNFTHFPTVGPVLSERERIRMEFYQTYDIMTGIRIAATLGGFFTMMVLLVLYKSKCKSRAHESLEAAITAVVAEEEELEAVLNQSKFDFIEHGPRQSLGNMSAPTYTRFLSVGGYSTFINPPIKRFDRLAKGRISLPTSDISFRHFTSVPASSISSQDQKSSNFWKSYKEEDENDLVEVEESEDTNDRNFLQVPNQQNFHIDSHVNSCMERRGSCSAVEYFSKTNKEDLKCPTNSTRNQPNIQVIQATPQMSPCESSSGLLDDQCMLSDQPLTVPERKLAPLASIGSCSAISSIESENRSMGSDSVFINNENIEDDEDTDKDQNEEELFSAKSDQDCTNKKYRIIPTLEHSNCFVTAGNKIETRRFSDSGMQLCTSTDKANGSLFPIVTNLASHASNQITTSLYSKQLPDECSNSSTSLSSSFSYSNSTSSDKRKKGTFSRIAVIDVLTTSSPIKTDRISNMKKKLSLSKSEPKTINTFSDNSNSDLRTLSLRNLLNSKEWSKETLF